MTHRTFGRGFLADKIYNVEDAVLPGTFEALQRRRKRRPVAWIWLPALLVAGLSTFVWVDGAGHDAYPGQFIGTRSGDAPSIPKSNITPASKKQVASLAPSSDQTPNPPKSDGSGSELAGQGPSSTADDLHKKDSQLIENQPKKRDIFSSPISLSRNPHHHKSFKEVVKLPLRHNGGNVLAKYVQKPGSRASASNHIGNDETKSSDLASTHTDNYLRQYLPDGDEIHKNQAQGIDYVNVNRSVFPVEVSKPSSLGLKAVYISLGAVSLAQKVTVDPALYQRGSMVGFHEGQRFRTTFTTPAVGLELGLSGRASLNRWLRLQWGARSFFFYQMVQGELNSSSTQPANYASGGDNVIYATPQEPTRYLFRNITWVPLAPELMAEFRLPGQSWGLSAGATAYLAPQTYNRLSGTVLQASEFSVTGIIQPMAQLWTERGNTRVYLNARMVRGTNLMPYPLTSQSIGVFMSAGMSYRIGY